MSTAKELRLEADRLRREARDKPALKSRNANSTPADSAAAPTPAAELYRQAAEQGDAQAQFMLGFLQLSGQEGLVRDAESAAVWLERAAEQNHGQALYRLALLARKGVPAAICSDDASRRRRAQELVEKAAHAGEPNAMTELADRFEHAEPPQAEQALEWYRKAAETGLAPRAALTLAEMRDAKDRASLIALYQRAADQYKAAAESGEVAAMIKYGCMLRDGLEVPADGEHKAVRVVKIDAVKAHEFLKIAAKREVVEAEFELARFYEQKRRDTRESMKLYKTCVRKGHLGAHERLGLMLRDNRDVTPDKELSAKMFEIAHARGSLVATSNLAYMTHYGIGTPQSYTRALELYRLAADRGDVSSQYQLGLLLLEGVGVKRDAQEGLKWIARAAEQGDVTANFQLGMQHYLGAHLPRDLDAACSYFRRSAAQRDALSFVMLFWISVVAKHAAQWRIAVAVLMALAIIPLAIAVDRLLRPKP